MYGICIFSKMNINFCEVKLSKLRFREVVRNSYKMLKFRDIFPVFMKYVQYFSILFFWSITCLVKHPCVDTCEIVHVTYHMFVSVVTMTNTNDAIM